MGRSAGPVVPLRPRASVVVVAALITVALSALGTACGSGGSAPALTLDSGAAATCPVEAPAEEAAYKPPRASRSDCAAQIGIFVGRFFAQEPPPTYTELERAVIADPSLGGAACAACIFTKAEDELWGPVVYETGGSGAAILDYGACYARAPSGTEACGEAVQRSRACVDAVCSREDCVTEGAARTCSQRALGDPAGCGRYPVSEACGDLLAPLSRSCASLADLVVVMCAAEAPARDAGVEAGADAAR